MQLNDQSLLTGASEKLAGKRSIPTKSGKTSASTLGNIRTLDVTSGADFQLGETALFRCEVARQRYDYLWQPKPNATRLFVLFSGDAKRDLYEPPVFQRWSWADHFPGHCLYVSDPMLHMSPDIGLAWYSGTESVDPLEVITQHVLGILPQLGLVSADVTAYGSSGGGFAAIRLTTKHPDISAIAINPQTNIAKFAYKTPDLYARTCLNRSDRHRALADFPERMDLLSHVPTLKQRKLILIQNRLDLHHYDDHYTPFCRAMGCTGEENLTEGNLRRILFDHEGGHGKAETPEAFATALWILQSNLKQWG